MIQVSHLLVFKQFTALDFDLAATLLIGLPTAFLAGEWQMGLLTLRISTVTVIECYLQFYAFLSLSIIAYRLSPFHRLYQFPGPPICKITKLWIVYIAYKGQYYKFLKDLHDKYGDVVRVGEFFPSLFMNNPRTDAFLTYCIGPEEVSIGNAEGVIDVLGAGGLPKGRCK